MKKTAAIGICATSSSPLTAEIDGRGEEGVGEGGGGGEALLASGAAEFLGCDGILIRLFVAAVVVAAAAAAAAAAA